MPEPELITLDRGLEVQLMWNDGRSASFLCNTTVYKTYHILAQCSNFLTEERTVPLSEDSNVSLLIKMLPSVCGERISQLEHDVKILKDIVGAAIPLLSEKAAHESHKPNTRSGDEVEQVTPREKAAVAVKDYMKAWKDLQLRYPKYFAKVDG